MKIILQSILFICYCILGFIIAPFVGWFIFFVTLSDSWCGFGKKGGEVPEPLDIKLTDEDLNPEKSSNPESQDTKAPPEKVEWKDASMYYPNKGGRMWN